MLLNKDGVTIDVTHKADIGRYLGWGFVKVEAPQPEEPIPAGEVDSLEQHTVAELKVLAESMDLEGYSGLKKADLIALIEGKEEVSDDAKTG